MSLPLVLRAATTAERRDLESALPSMDEEEFRAFYERTARPLWAYLARVTGDPYEADDVLQEAHYRFCRAGARYESESHRRNSLFQIATNVVRDRARRSLLVGQAASLVLALGLLAFFFGADLVAGLRHLTATLHLSTPVLLALAARLLAAPVAGWVALRQK